MQGAAAEPLEHDFEKTRTTIQRRDSSGDEAPAGSASTLAVSSSVVVISSSDEHSGDESAGDAPAARWQRRVRRR